MASQLPPGVPLADGQFLSHDPNDPALNARAGFGGDIWGAFGGGFTPNLSSKTHAVKLSYAAEEASATFGPNNIPVLAGMSTGSVPATALTADYTADDNTTGLWSADIESPLPSADNLF